MRHFSLSPAKVNLLLKVVSKRPDGYHNLFSVVDLVSLHDVIHLEENADDAVVVRDNLGLLPTGADNTIYRAIMLLKERYGIKLGINVFVEKHIPLGSGLGGGSSNAATVMKELVRLWDIRVDQEELIELGRRVGSDVPLFLHGKSCIMQGVGEKIIPFPLPFVWYLIVYPDVVISTRDVYNGLRIVLTKQENEVTFSKKFSTALDIADILENDLEQVAISRCPKIETIKKLLRDAGAVGSLMTGSGSAVFGIYEREEDAREALEKVRGFGSVFIAHSV